MTDRFVFYSKSADAEPGKGVHEQHNGEFTQYLELSKIPHWRRILSNFWIAPFSWKGKRWNTVEHAFQATKFKDLDPEFYNQMSLDSDSELSKGDGLVARKKRKHILLTPDQLGAWDAQSKGILKELLVAKFTQNLNCYRVLHETLPAHLYHYPGRGAPLERWSDLEEIRYQFRLNLLKAPME